MSAIDVLEAWLPGESEITEVSLSTAESTEIDLSSYSGKGLRLVIGCDVAFKLSANAAGTITTAKAVHPPGVYVYKIHSNYDFVQVKAIAGTGYLSWYIEKGS